MSNDLIDKIKNCHLCTKKLPFPPLPILQFSAKSKLLIVGQAPGIRAHETEKPWNDPSGERLRDWLGIDKKTFYDTEQIALVPMGFCYPGKAKSGDLPPLKICAETWQAQIRTHIENVKLTFLIGAHAQHYCLSDNLNLTQRCRNWKNYLPEYVVLPHPSPRNNIWLKQNEWFESETLPDLKRRVKKLLTS